MFYPFLEFRIKPDIAVKILIFKGQLPTVMGYIILPALLHIRKFKFHQKMTRIAGTLHEDLFTFMMVPH
jgi:hypothetical protein